MKLSVTVTPLDAARLAARAAELVARRRANARPRNANEVSDGERELGPAAGDLRGADGQ